MSMFCEFIMAIFCALLILRYLYQVETLTDRVKALEQAIKIESEEK